MTGSNPDDPELGAGPATPPRVDAPAGGMRP